MPFREDSALSEYKKNVRALALIPLEDGRWVSGTQSAIYFPRTKKSEIPDDLGLNLVLASAIETHQRVELYQHLGVKKLAPPEVIELIYRRYEVHGLGRKIDKEHSRHHLLYLFQNLPEDVQDVKHNVHLIGEDGEVVSFSVPLQEVHRMYFDGPDGEYDPGQLFAKRDRQKLRKEGAHFFVNRLGDDQRSARNDGKTFNNWLEDHFGVTRTVHLPVGRAFSGTDSLMSSSTSSKNVLKSLLAC